MWYLILQELIDKEVRRMNKYLISGFADEIIIEAVKNSGAMDDNGIIEPLLTKERMYELGLSGKAESKAKRAALIKKLNLPENLSANALIDAINALGEDHQVKTYLNSLGENNV